MHRFTILSFVALLATGCHEHAESPPVKQLIVLDGNSGSMFVDAQGQKDGPLPQATF